MERGDTFGLVTHKWSLLNQHLSLFGSVTARAEARRGQQPTTSLLYLRYSDAAVGVGDAARGCRRGDRVGRAHRLLRACLHAIASRFDAVGIATLGDDLPFRVHSDWA